MWKTSRLGGDRPRVTHATRSVRSAWPGLQRPRHPPLGERFHVSYAIASRVFTPRYLPHVRISPLRHPPPSGPLDPFHTMISIFGVRGNGVISRDQWCMTVDRFRRRRFRPRARLRVEVGLQVLRSLAQVCTLCSHGTSTPKYSRRNFLFFHMLRLLYVLPQKENIKCVSCLFSLPVSHTNMLYVPQGVVLNEGVSILGCLSYALATT